MSGRNSEIPRQFQRVWNRKEIQQRANKRGGALATQDREKFNRVFPHMHLWNERRMSDEERMLYVLNPHARQVFATFRDPVVLNRKLEEADRVVGDNTPHLKYQRRRNEWKTVDHWGQRKLLFSEIEFLTKYAEPGRVVVYAGAAPGDHTNFLSDMFPDVQFVLVDPADFTCKETDRIELVQDFFDTSQAERFATEEYRGRVLFISDIRSWDENTSEAEKEKRVEIDMQNQKEWTELMVPVASMFKFRLPYEKGKTTYFDGDIFLPVWGGRTTSETRLIVESYATDPTTPFTYKDYDHGTYEDVMYAHNTLVRTSFFDVDQVYLDMDIGYDRCYDCASEIYLLEQYMRIYIAKGMGFGEGVTHDQLAQAVKDLAAKIDTQCSSSGRTLRTREDISRDPHFLAAVGLADEVHPPNLNDLVSLDDIRV